MVQEVILNGEKTDQELIAEGTVLMQQAQQNARELGKWYNSVKWGRTEGLLKQNTGVTRDIPQMSAKALCAAVPELRYGTAKNYGQVVEAFPTEASQQGIPFSSCHTLIAAKNYLDENVGPDAWRLFFLDIVAAKCTVTDVDTEYVYGDPFSREDIRRQVALVTGNTKRLTSNPADKVAASLIDKVNKILGENVAKSKVVKVSALIDAEINNDMKDMKNSYHDDINKEAKKLAADDLKVYQGYTEKLKRKEKLLDAQMKGLPKFLSKADYKFLLNCLHSDRAPEDRKTRFAKAFDIVTRLEEGVEW